MVDFYYFRLKTHIYSRCIHTYFWTVFLSTTHASAHSDYKCVCVRLRHRETAAAVAMESRW